MQLERNEYEKTISNPSFVWGLERALSNEEIEKFQSKGKPFPTAAEAAKIEERKKRRVPNPIKVYVGIDLGKELDRTVIVVVEPVGDDAEHPIYLIRRVIPVQLGTSYPDIVRGLVELDKGIKNLNAREITYVIDAGGALGVVDSFEEALPLSDIYRVNITGGINVKVNGLKISVPKRELITTLMRVMDDHRLKVLGTRTDGVELLQSELNNFQLKITESGLDRYEAGGSNQHDDAALSLAMAIFFGEREARLGEIQLW